MVDTNEAASGLAERESSTNAQLMETQVYNLHFAARVLYLSCSIVKASEKVLVVLHVIRSNGRSVSAE
jgi:hypothetical protein